MVAEVADGFKTYFNQNDERIIGYKAIAIDKDDSEAAVNVAGFPKANAAFILFVGLYEVNRKRAQLTKKWSHARYKVADEDEQDMEDTNCPMPVGLTSVAMTPDGSIFVVGSFDSSASWFSIDNFQGVFLCM